MQQNIVIQGYTLSITSLPIVGATLTFTFKSPSSATAATRTSGKGGAAVVIDKIDVECEATGPWSPGTFDGSGKGSITASTPRVECEGKQMLRENDFVSVTCSGNIVTSSGSTPASAQCTVTITDGAQKNVDANNT